MQDEPLTEDDVRRIVRDELERWERELAAKTERLAGED